VKQVKAVLALSLAACSTWRVDTRPAPEALAAEKPRTVRLFLKTGARVQLHDVSLVGDSVVGLTQSPVRPWPIERVAVATSDIAQVEFLKSGVGTTIALIVIVIAAGALIGVCQTLRSVS
jgi:hypothetical protein